MSDELSISDKRALILSQITAVAKSVDSDCKRDSNSGQARHNVTLVAVSKVQPDWRIAEMLAAGQTIFGENRVQDARARWQDRFASARKDIELRLIGPLQSNKVGEAVELFDVIETVDREKLAKTLASVRQKGARLPRLLVQVNTGEEPQKSGIAPRDFVPFLTKLKTTYDLHPVGVMCIPPVAKDVGGQAVAPHFWALKNLADAAGLGEISMGMSADFETAIKLGATHVRLGTALFGPRKLSG